MTIEDQTRDKVRNAIQKPAAWAPDGFNFRAASAALFLFYEAWNRRASGHGGQTCNWRRQGETTPGFDL